MTKRSVWFLILIAVGACAPTPPPPPIDMVVLVPDPEDGAVGEASVSAEGRSVDLTEAGEATRVLAGETPAPPVVLPPEEVEAIFGAALAAQPLPPRTFLLYFSSGSNLTAESRALLPEIVEAAGRPGADVAVIGHTDTTGSERQNYGVGLTRAQAILEVLLEAGLDVSEVVVDSHGEANPLEPTGDDVANARNRRVEVTVR